MKTGMELLACAERTRPLRPYAYIVYSSGTLGCCPWGP